MKVLAFIHTYAQDGDYGSFMLELINGFKQAGVELYVYKTNDLVGDLNSKNYCSSTIEKSVLRTISSIKPDLIFSTNRGGITRSIMTVFPEIPRITWLVDRNPFKHNGGDETTLFDSNDLVITSSSSNISRLESLFPELKDKVIYLPFMTNPNSFNHKKQKDINISFVGSLFMNHHVLIRFIEVNKSNKGFIRGVFRALKEIEKDYDIDVEVVMKKNYIYDFLAHHGFNASDFKAVCSNIISNNKRIKVLDSVADLGLKLYGTENWPSIINCSTSLVSCYQFGDFIKTRKDLCDVYDRSKIAINVNHHQATTGQGYRVFDILASNALLITNYQAKSDLELLFGENHPIPVYRTEDECRQLVQFYLENEAKRQELVKKCNDLVKHNHTFVKRAKEIIQLSGVDLKAINSIGEIHYLKLSRFNTYVLKLCQGMFFTRRVVSRFLSGKQILFLKKVLKK